MDLNNKFGWQHIEGWFGYAKIYDKIIREAGKNDLVFEVGKWLGKSSCYLASRAKMSGKNIRIVCVDSFEKTLPAFNENMTKAGVIDSICTMVMTSELASYNIENESAFAVFIENGEARDIHNWYPKIKPGGIIAGYNLDNSINHTMRSIDVKEFQNEEGIWFARKPKSIRLN